MGLTAPPGGCSVPRGDDPPIPPAPHGGGKTVFDEATAVRRRADGLYDARPDQRFALVTPGGTAPPAVNGGALIATVLRAVLDCSPNPHPVGPDQAVRAGPVLGSGPYFVRLEFPGGRFAWLA